MAHRFEDNTKIFKVETDDGVSFIGMAGTVAHFPVLRKAMGSMPREILKLGSKDEVFDTFTKLHPYLKDNFFLQTKEEDSDPYESSQFSVVIANASGIYGLYSYREVFEFKEFWGIGSGRSFALGAMHAAYAKAKTAREVAEAGIARRLRVRPQLRTARATSSPSKQRKRQRAMPVTEVKKSPTSGTSRTWP